MRRLLRTTFRFCFLACFASVFIGCVGPMTGHVLERSTSYDPTLETVNRAYVENELLIIMYEPGQPRQSRQDVLRSEYIAKGDLAQFDVPNYLYNRLDWVIYRRGSPEWLKEAELESVTLLTRPEILEKKEEDEIAFADSLLWISKEYAEEFPLLFVNQQRDSPYRSSEPWFVFFPEERCSDPIFIQFSPRGRWVRPVSVALNSWRFPLAIAKDFFFYSFIYIVQPGPRM